MSATGATEVASPSPGADDAGDATLAATVTLVAAPSPHATQLAPAMPLEAPHSDAESDDVSRSLSSSPSASVVSSAFVSPSPSPTPSSSFSDDGSSRPVSRGTLTPAATTTTTLGVVGASVGLAPRPPVSPAPARRRRATHTQPSPRPSSSDAQASAQATASEPSSAADPAATAAVSPSFVVEVTAPDGASSIPASAAASPSSLAGVSTIARPAPLFGLTRGVLEPDAAPAAFMPATVPPARIDDEEARSAPVRSILAERYDTAAASSPSGGSQQGESGVIDTRKFGFERAFEEQKATANAAAAAQAASPAAAQPASPSVSSPTGADTDASSAAPAPWVPYHLQGDSSLYAPGVLVVRAALQFHPRVARWLQRFWHSFAHGTHVGFMSYREYEAMHLRISKALYTAWNREDAVRLCKLDWRRDTRALPGVARAVLGGLGERRRGGGALLSYAHFSRALFELVDLWTTTVDVAEYDEFLAVLYARITRIPDSEVAPPLPSSPSAQRRSSDNQAELNAARNARAEKRSSKGADASSAPPDLSLDSKPPEAGSVVLPSQRSGTDDGAEVAIESSLSSGPIWGGFGYHEVESYRTNVAEIRERKRARAEVLAYREAHGCLPGSMRDDVYLIGSSGEGDDSGTTRILPVVDHVREAEEQAERMRNDPDDTLNQRFPAPQFAKRATSSSSSSSSPSPTPPNEMQLQIRTDEVETEELAQEEMMQAALSIASPRGAQHALAHALASPEELAQRKAHRLMLRQAEADAEAEPSLHLPTEASGSATPQQPPASAGEGSPSSQHVLTLEKGPEDASASATTPRRARRKTRRRRSRSRSRSRSLSPVERPAHDSSPRRRQWQAEGQALRSPVSLAQRRALAAARERARIAREKLQRGEEDPSNSWARRFAAKQEDAKRALLARALAARKRAKAQRALLAAQKRLAEQQRMDSARRRAQHEIEERELAFFRALDESIAQADPSYVPPPLPVGAAAATLRADSVNVSLGRLDPTDLRLSAQTIRRGGSDANSAAAGSKLGVPGYRTRPSTLTPRARRRAKFAAATHVSEEELAKAREARRRLEERRALAHSVSAELIAEAEAEAEEEKKEGAKTGEEGDELSPPGLANQLDELYGDSVGRPVPLDSIQPLDLDDSLAPLDDSGAFDEYTPQLQAHLSAEIAQLRLLDAKLARTFGGNDGPGPLGHKFSPWEVAAAAAAAKASKKISTPSMLTPAERAAAKVHLLSAAKRLKFLRRKTTLAARSGLEDKTEVAELAELERKLAGRVNEHGDVTDLSSLSVALHGLRERDEAERTGRYTGFKVAHVPAPLNRGEAEAAARAEGAGRFWLVRQRRARRRVLKYSALAILQAEEDSGSEPLVLDVDLRAAPPPLPTTIPTQRSSVKAYKTGAIQRLLDTATTSGEEGVTTLLGQPAAMARKSWDQQRADELEAEGRHRAARLARQAQGVHFSRRMPPRLVAGSASGLTLPTQSSSVPLSPLLEQEAEEGADDVDTSQQQHSSDSSFDSRSNSDSGYSSSESRESESVANESDSSNSVFEPRSGDECDEEGNLIHRGLTPPHEARRDASRRRRARAIERNSSVPTGLSHHESPARPIAVAERSAPSHSSPSPLPLPSRTHDGVSVERQSSASPSASAAVVPPLLPTTSLPSSPLSSLLSPRTRLAASLSARPILGSTRSTQPQPQHTGSQSARAAIGGAAAEVDDAGASLAELAASAQLDDRERRALLLLHRKSVNASRRLARSTRQHVHASPHRASATTLMINDASGADEKRVQREQRKEQQMRQAIQARRSQHPARTAPAPLRHRHHPRVSVASHTGEAKQESAALELVAFRV